MLKKSLTILYGSQTGTACDVAEKVWRESKFFDFTTCLFSMDEYPIEKLIYEQLILFVCSTTGQGEEPDNMKVFWKFLLRRNLPSSSLQNVYFAVLGLGDSSYVKFNFVAKRLHRRLIDLGGHPLLEVGLADEQHDLGLDAVIDPWLAKFWNVLAPLYQFVAKPVKLFPESRWRIETSDAFAKYDLPNNQFSQKNPCMFKVLENIRMTCETHFQDVRLIKFSAPFDLNYQPGDVLMLAPQNIDDDVRLFFEIINKDRDKQLHPDTNVKIYKKEEGLPVPEYLNTCISLKDCAKVYWNLNAVPRRRVFSLLAHVTDSDLEREKLLEFSETSGQEDLYNYCNRQHRTILEVLSDFPNATKKISLDFLFDVMEPIRPRAFSIASSPSMHKDELHVLLAVVSYKTKLVTPRKGLCSSYLAQIEPGSFVSGWIRSGSFKFPPPGTPVIMVGPGTGIAPFRSYIQELSSKKQANMANLLIFFGCRNQKGDFHFEDEWNLLQKSGDIDFHVAFSRDQPDKIYVQHIIAQQSQRVWKFLKNNNGFIFVAGSSKNMPNSVREAFISIIETEGGLNNVEAKKFVEQMERLGRYQTETWS